MYIYLGEGAKMILNVASRSVSNTKVTQGAKRVLSLGSNANIVFSLKRNKI